MIAAVGSAELAGAVAFVCQPLAFVTYAVGAGLGPKTLPTIVRPCALVSNAPGTFVFAVTLALPAPPGAFIVSVVGVGLIAKAMIGALLPIADVAFSRDVAVLAKTLPLTGIPLAAIEGVITVFELTFTLIPAGREVTGIGAPGVLLFAFSVWQIVLKLTRVSRAVCALQFPFAVFYAVAPGAFIGMLQGLFSAPAMQSAVDKAACQRAPVRIHIGTRSGVVELLGQNGIGSVIRCGQNTCLRMVFSHPGST